MYARTVRPLTDQEERRLRRRLARRPRLSLRSPRLWVVFGVVSSVFWVLTVLASKLVFWPSVLWASLGILMALWSGWEEERKSRAERRRIESALATNRAEEIRVVTTEAVALDEVEDLGEAWAFQVEPDRILFVGPRQDLPRRFPTTDFSFVQVYDADGDAIDFRFNFRGERLAPLRRISAEAQRGFDLSHVPEILSGRLEELEALLEHRERRG